MSFEARFHPEGQVKQSPPLSNLPSEHIWQRVLLSGAVHPVGQSSHLIPFVANWYLFAGHCVQSVTPVVEENVPGTQGKQLACASLG